MDYESFIDAFGDVPTDLAGDYSQLYIFRAEDFGAWCRRVRDAHEREVDGAVDSMTDADLAEHGLVRMPTDADGVPIHVGDVIDERLPFGGYAAPAPVDVMELSRGANGYVWMVRLDAANSAFINPKRLRHHHEPTVEDVLREFALACEDAGNAWPEVERIAAEYAAALRLAGEGE